jgi:tetratricopeptide (TPR) repeat protein
MPAEQSRIVLPEAPTGLADQSVKAWREPVAIDTYAPAAPDRYPAYLDQRVYQGSSGAVYPLPFIDAISREKAPRDWDAIHLENEYVRLMILPELGGRIHIGLDKTRGYDFFYRNDVIKPALVGLAGPWVSGGVEFNWPQHHRPATHLPVESRIESEADGAVTVWCSDHDPFARMQGMHGIRLRPASALIELRGHLVNRTDDVQTFLWWANVAAKAGEDYQSFFPTDVRVVADHAKRATTTFPAAQDYYYGVDYPSRRAAEHPDGDRLDGDRLDWYRNIPVPTSYMCLGSEDDFFGGYDHGVGAGFVHWADHRTAPGKKQWTWGNAPFGWAWDAHLTDDNGPYVELMAGVFTDNQPDFAFLAPGETKTFSQYWYPIQGTGPVHQATREAAVRLDVDGTRIRIAAAVTSPRPGASILLRAGDRVLYEAAADLAPGAPHVHEFDLPGEAGIAALEVDRAGPRGDGVGPSPRTDAGAAVPPHGCELTVEHEGQTLVTWRPRPEPETPPVVEPATEPPVPADIASVDELYLTGVHLDQYRHATRSPEPYWEEALRRDPGDARCGTALAARRMRAGRLDDAERLLRTAVERLTRRNPNPRDGEAHYRLGLVLARLGRDAEAKEAFGKALWDQAWADAAAVATARLDLAARRDAEPGLREVVARSPRHTQARNLLAVALLRRDERETAAAILAQTLRGNPLDAWARDLAARLVAAESPVSEATPALRTCAPSADATITSEPTSSATGREATPANRSIHDASPTAVATIAHRSTGTATGPEATFDCRWLRDAVPTTDPTMALDIALEYRTVHEYGTAIDLLETAARLAPDPGQVNVGPLAWLHRADLEFERGDETAADAALQRLRTLDRTWCFPSQAEDDALARLRARRPEDAVLAALAGHRLYAAGRHEEAITAWEAAVATADPVVDRDLGGGPHYLKGGLEHAVDRHAPDRTAVGDPVVLRNLGVAAHNVQCEPERAAHWYERARAAAPDDARLLYEADQLDARRGVDPVKRLAALEDRRDLVAQRDDLTVQLAELLTAADRAGDAVELLAARAFQPWEGGEGRVLAAWEDAHVALARAALAAEDPQPAVCHAEAALAPPPNLGEARHPLANTADLHLLLGDTLAAARNPIAARHTWEQAATQQGDFQTMRVQVHSEHTAAAVTALRRLGRTDAAQALRDDLARHIEEQARTEARIDYFATSLPTMLLFTADLQAAHDTRVLVLRTQLALLDGESDRATALAVAALGRDPLNSPARAVARQATQAVRKGAS